MIKDIKSIEDKRLKHNQDIVRRMRQGETLSGFSSESSFFPPRPIIKKDLAVVKKLYKLETVEE